VWVDAQRFQNEWIGYDAPTDQDKITAWLGKAERMIRLRVPGIQQRIDSGEPDLADNVADVVIAMVTRVFRNPEGMRSTNSTTGALSESITYGGDNPGTLEILPSELAMLTGGTQGTHRAGALSMIPPWSPFYRKD
jgi:hypothetical protein